MSEHVASKERLTVDAFLERIATETGRRFELDDGAVIEMATERVVHADCKAAAFVALRDAVRAGRLPCHVYPDGIAMRVDDWTVYEPDASVRCGAPLHPDTVVVEDPIIVVEVLSPSTRGLDGGAKYLGYLSLPTVRHYVMIDPAKRVVIHHRPHGDGTVSSAIVGPGGHLALDPPGLHVAVDDLLPPDA